MILGPLACADAAVCETWWKLLPGFALFRCQITTAGLRPAREGSHRGTAGFHLSRLHDDGAHAREST